MKRSHLIVLSILLAIGALVAAAMYRYSHPPIVAITGPATAPATAPASAPTSRAVAKKERGPTTQLLDILRAERPRYPTTQRLDAPVSLKYAAHAVIRDPIYLDLQGNLWITRADGPAEFDFHSATRTDTATHVMRDVVRFVLWSVEEPSAAAALRVPGRKPSPWVPHVVVQAASGFDLVDADGRRHLPDSLGFKWDRAQVLYAAAGAKDQIIVPTATGICAFAFSDSPEQIIAGHQRLIDPAKHKPAECAVQTAMDLQGVLAWVTNVAGNKGLKGTGIARFAPVEAATPADGAAAAPQYRWTILTGKPGWPEQIVHMIPLLDGSVLHILTPDTTEPADKDKVNFSMNAVAPAGAAIDKGKVVKLVFELSSPELEKRDAAFAALTQYGPGITPLLEKLLEDASPEARVRIEQLLKNKVEPGLGGMSLVDGRMRLVSRLADGGVIFYAEAGVSIPHEGDDQPQYVTPAWLSIRPGFPVELLPPGMVTDLNPDKQKIIGWQREWIVIDPVTGPSWYLGNRLEPILKKSEKQFADFAGIDATGRWLFRSTGEVAEPVLPEAGIELPAVEAGASQQSAKPVNVAATNVATTRPAAIPATGATSKPIALDTTKPASATNPGPIARASVPATLILDPRLPDVTPRLPGWELPHSAGKVGWDKAHWPVIFIDAQPKPIPWALQESDWRVIDPAKENVFTEPGDVLVPTFPPLPVRKTAATTSPSTTTAPAGTTKPATTMATTGPSTREAELDAEIAGLGTPLLITPDGTRYYDGRQTLKILKADGSLTSWPLPDKAIGTAKPTLLRTSDGLLFLFNEPARIVRLRENNAEDGGAPLEFETVFTRKVPTDASPLRIWLDPAERICIAHSGGITVFFATGRIPRSIAEKMPADDTPDE